jgi:hypothetical protein
MVADADYPPVRSVEGGLALLVEEVEPVREGDLVRVLVLRELAQ